MADDAARPRRSTPVGIDHPVQWIVCVVTALLALVLVVDLPRLTAPGAPAGLLYASAAAALIAATLNFPPLFYRLPHLARWSCFATVLGAAALISTAHGQVAAAWARTPQGLAEIEAERQQAAKQQAQADADADAARQRVAQGNQALEACFSMFRHDIPSLTRQVKEGLNNPSSFEHVKTETIGDSTAPYNVVLTFRGENPFSAIVTETVSAKINPADCSVEAIATPTD